MTGNFVSRETIHFALVALMGVCLALTIITLPLALVWIRQPIGNAAATVSDVFAAGFSFAFLAAFALAAMGQRSRQQTKETDDRPTCRVDRLSSQ